MLKRLVACKPGFTLAEVALGMVVVAAAMTMLPWFMGKIATETRKMAVAGQFKTVLRAAEDYVRLHDGDLRADTTETTGRDITMAMLRDDNCLPERFVRTDDAGRAYVRNGWGQEYRVTARLTPEGDLAAVVATVGGRGADNRDRAFAGVTVPETAALAGVGFVPVSPATVIRGPYGSWETTLAALGLDLEPGHLAMVSSLDPRELGQEFLYRDGVPGHPELNEMGTDLSLGGHDLNHAGGIQYDPRDATDMADFCSISRPEDIGRTFVDPQRGMYLCRADESGNPKVTVVSDSGNSMALQNAVIMSVEEGENEIEVPACPVGSNTEPEVYVFPVFAAAARNEEEAKRVMPLHSFQAWADPAEGSTWKIHLQLLASDNQWVTPTKAYGQVAVLTTCSKN